MRSRGSNFLGFFHENENRLSLKVGECLVGYPALISFFFPIQTTFDLEDLHVVEMESIAAFPFQFSSGSEVSHFGGAGSKSVLRGIAGMELPCTPVEQSHLLLLEILAIISILSSVIAVKLS